MTLTNGDTTLIQISNKINVEIRSIKQGFMHIGELLCVARERFPGDREFGQWCKEQEFEISGRTRSCLMQVYRRYEPMLSVQSAAGKKLPSWSILYELRNLSDEDIGKALDADLSSAEAREIAKENHWDAWKAKKDAQREEGAAKILGADPMAASRARDTADDILSKQQDPARIGKAKKDANPDGEYIAKNEAEKDRRLEEIRNRVLAENPDLKEEFEEEDEIDRARRNIDEQRQDREALDEAVSTINHVWNPENLQMMTLQKATRAFALWQVIVQEYLNEDR